MVIVPARRTADPTTRARQQPSWPGSPLAPRSRGGHAELGVSGRGCLARPASSVVSLPHDDSGSATTGTLKAVPLIVPECQVAGRTASPIRPSDLPPLRPPPPGLPRLSYRAGAAAARDGRER